MIFTFDKLIKMIYLIHAKTIKCMREVNNDSNILETTYYVTKKKEKRERDTQ